MSAELASSNCAYRLDRDPGRSVPMPALASPTTLGASGGTKFSPHDTYSTSSVPMSSMPSSSYSSPCSEKMRRAGKVSSSFTVASSSSSAIEAGRTAFLPTMAPTRRRVMRVGIDAGKSRRASIPIRIRAHLPDPARALLAAGRTPKITQQRRRASACGQGLSCEALRAIRSRDPGHRRTPPAHSAPTDPAVTAVALSRRHTTPIFETRRLFITRGFPYFRLINYARPLLQTKKPNSRPGLFKACAQGMNGAIPSRRL